MLAEFQTLVDALRCHTKERPLDTAATFLLDGEQERVSWSYLELDQRANDIAASLLSRDLSGQRALLLHPPGLEFIAALYGCFYAGVVAVPTYPPRLRIDSRASTRLIELVADVKPAVALTTEANVAKGSLWSARVMGACPMEWLATDGSDFRVRRAPVNIGLPSDSVAMLQYTSGSTRSPKGVILTHQNLMDNERAIATQMRHSAASTALIWLPPYHDMGLIGGILQPITVGFPVTLMDPLHVLQRPARWLQAITRTKATTSGAPNSIFELCLRTVRDEERDGLDLHSWTVAFTGSEPVRAATVERFSEVFAPCGFRSEAFFPCYGLAEATLMVSGRSGLSQSGRARSISCGPPAPGVDVAIVDAESLQECEEGQTGEVWVCGSSVARGYWNRADETHRTFENALPGRLGKFLRTGDLGFLRGGELSITGRIKDLVIVRGRNFYPQDLELCAGVSHPALSPDACVAFAVDSSEGEHLVVGCELRREDRNRTDGDEIIQAVREAIAEEFEIGGAAILLLKPASILRTTSGKVRRNACRQAFLDGGWEFVGRSAEKPPAKDESSSLLGNRVRRELCAILNTSGSRLDDQKPLASLGVDSLMRLELLLRLESELAVRLDSGLMTDETTTADLIHAVESALERQPPCAVPKRARAEIGQLVPLTPIQREFLNVSEAPQKYAIVLSCRTPPGTDGQALEEALVSFEQRHDTFRFRFQRLEGQWIQVYGNRDTAIEFRRLDMRDATREKVRLTARQLFAETAGNLNINKGPLVQAVFLDRGAEENGMLLLSVHHLIVDGASIPLLLFDLERAYLNQGGLHSDISYTEWAERLDALAQAEHVHHDLHYWQEVCHSDFSDFGVPRGRAMSSPIMRLDPLQSRRFLERFPTAQEQHDFFLAALAQAWHQVTGQPELLIQLENHGRLPIGGVAPVRTVGWCAHHFPARIDAGGSQGDAALNHVRAQLAGIPNNGLSFGLLKYLCRDPEVTRAMHKLPLPQASMVYRGRMAVGFRRDRIFPVIAHYVLDAAGREITSQPALRLSAGLDGQIAWWDLNYRPENFAPDLVGRITAEIQKFVANI